jgi:alkylhydroperoxidase/carboxymuconolactone decarboxylase family protein YurZ
MKTIHITKSAVKNHEELFPKLESKLQQTDPEFIELPLEGQSTTTARTRFEKGVAAQKAIFGEAIDKMRQQAPKDQRHIQDFLAANCFGDYYTPNGLEIKTRELLTFAMLISLGGCEPQVKQDAVHGHLPLRSAR